MKEINKKIELSKLLAGKMLNSLNDEQEAMLEKFNEDSDNEKIVQDILDFKNFDDWNRKQAAISTSKEWGHFVKNMKASGNRGKVIKMKVVKTISAIAAIFIIGFAVNYTYQSFNSLTQYHTIAESNIPSGKPNAQLTLGSGVEVDLEKAVVNVIEEGSMSIANNKGVLQYSQSEEKKTVEPVVNRLTTPRGGEYQLVLPDGTKVWLNSDSELVYTVPFSENQRKVSLKGEAYFDVAHDKNKPFIVESNNQNIEVLGTEFNVSAYSEDINMVTTLVNGKVKVGHSINDQNYVEAFLAPNEQLVFDKETSISLKHEVDTYFYTSWKDGRFKFENEPLESFFIKLSRWYDVDVFIADESIKEIRFTGDLPRYKDMADILSVIEAEMSVTIEIENNKVIYVSR